MRPKPLHYEFGDECAHFVWGLVQGLAAASILASPMYTLVVSCPPGNGDIVDVTSTVINVQIDP